MALCLFSNKIAGGARGREERIDWSAEVRVRKSSCSKTVLTEIIASALSWSTSTSGVHTPKFNR